MVSPLAKNKRAKNPKEAVPTPAEAPKAAAAAPASSKVSTNAAESKGSLGPSPFEGLSVPTAEPAPESAPAPASTPPAEA